jgi:hypothetical protein
MYVAVLLLPVKLHGMVLAEVQEQLYLHICGTCKIFQAGLLYYA